MCSNKIILTLLIISIVYIIFYDDDESFGLKNRDIYTEPNECDIRCMGLDSLLEQQECIEGCRGCVNSCGGNAQCVFNCYPNY